MSLVGNLALNDDRTLQMDGADGHARDRVYREAEDEEPTAQTGLVDVSASHEASTLVPSRAGSDHIADGEKGDAYTEKGLHADHERDEERQDRIREGEVRELARQLSRHSTTGTISDNPFSDNSDPRLDPSSPNFSARAWAKALLHLQSRDEKAYPLRTAGIAFRDLSAKGYGGGADYQKTVGNVPLLGADIVKRLMGNKGQEVRILRNFDGVVRSGEMCVVLGPPGSGCSTFLKTITGETHGFYVDEDSYMNYQGISAKTMRKDFRGEAIYCGEVDTHFPQLTVGQTLAFAAEARAARHPPGGVTRRQYAEHMRDVIMAMFGISHTINTRVGNDFVRGVSGGERKRVTIAEAALSSAPLQCWDNSTRGLDSANAIEFCKTLRMSTDLMGATAFVAIYQSPQAAYDYFDKVLVLYEGRQIYFGGAREAKKFFVDMGFYCPERQTTPDFLTSLTSAAERRPREGFEGKVPTTPDEFEKAWKSSQTYKDLLAEIDAFDKEFPIGGEALDKFRQSRRMQQAKSQRASSPYTLSYNQQVALCLRRGFWRLKADPSLTVTQILGNSIMGLIISSVFYNLQPTSGSFFQRGALLFFAILINAFGSALEILTLYAQRPIVEKHSRYALYHPSAEAYASMLTDLPYKIMNAIVFNIIIYFMTNLRREPGAFFFFLLTSFVLTLAMSMLFRCIGSLSRTLAQALAPAAILILALVIYTGFAIPVRDMLGWIRWFNYIDPIAYGFESLMINEFYGRSFTCNQFIPAGNAYADATGTSRVCQAVGGVPGSDSIDGGTYIATAYAYYHSHKWRNIGIIIAEMLFFLCVYLLATELISAKKSKGEVLVFRRGHAPKALTDPRASPEDIEAAQKGEKRPGLEESNGPSADAIIQRQTAIFHWQDVCYDIKIKGETRRILDHVDGWVKPGQLTALMGVSGAGKTTLLDVLATRVTMGVVTGEMLVDGRQRDNSFQRKTGYVQQQDLHLETSTVREALQFSALLRQPASTPRAEKIAYVDEVIKLLEMEPYADAVVGVPGEGLNVEQRKRLTIGVELAAKPQLLLFLDEPTSGLDSQTSWSIADLMEKLTKNGQAILCTIHQPSAMLFQRFDRLLFLAKGGKTVYFGPVGENSRILTNYFEKNGGYPCPPGENPAEWMLSVIGAAPGSKSDIDWHQTWLESEERKAVRDELADMKKNLPQQTQPAVNENDKASYRAFAAPLTVQTLEVTKRVFQQYWRTPSYIYAKIALCLFSALFIGFSFFNSPLSQQGLQNQMFAIFMLFTIFGQIIQQLMPHFVTQRALYEVRERPSKTYSWVAFMFSNIVVELPWATFCAVLVFFCWYYPIGLYKNAEPTNAVHERGALMFLYVWQFLLFAHTFGTAIIAALPTAETAGNLGNLMFSLCLIFCGVLAAPGQFPGFWIFMYRLSPFTYLVDGMLSVGLANQQVTCSDIEVRTLQPPGGQTCIAYLQDFISSSGGYLLNEQATSDCQFCPISSTNTFLTAVSASYDRRWRNFGILWAFIVFNICAAVGLYWLGRVPKKSKRTKKEE